MAVAATFHPAQAAWIDGVRRMLGSRAVGRIEPHVTLLPPHERTPEELEVLMAEVAVLAAQAPPPRIALRDVGVFENRRPIAYLGVEDEGGWLAERARSLGWPSERAFVPHVTILEGGDRAALRALAQLGAGFAEPARLRALSVLLARRRDPRRRWRPILEARFGESWVLVRSHLRLRVVVSDGAWAMALPPRRARSALAIHEGGVIGIVSAIEVSDAAWQLADARVFDPELRGFGVGGALVERVAASLAPRALVAPAGMALLESRGAAAVPRALAPALGLDQEMSWIALSLAS